MAQQTQLYRQVVEVAKDYLGPASERFVARQIAIHLKKEPSELAEADLNKLVDWIRLSVALLTDDQQLVDGFAQRVLSLGRKG